MLEKNKGIFWSIGLVIGCILWGASFYQMKDAMVYIQPLPFVAVRMFGGAIVIGVLALISGRNLLKHPKQGIILGVLLSSILITQTLGLKITTASNSGFITGMFIVTVPFFSLLFYKERTSLLKCFAIGVNLVGLWFLTGGLTRINAGDVWTLITALVCGVQIVYLSKIMKQEKMDAFVLCFQMFFVTALAALVFSLVLGIPYHFGSKGNILRIIYLIIFPTVLSFILQVVAQKYISTVRASLLLTAEPVSAALFAWTLGGEKYVPIAAFGGFLMVAGMIISEIPENKKIKKGAS